MKERTVFTGVKEGRKGRKKSDDCFMNSRDSTSSE